jgi:uncharacterized membrane protein
MALWLQGMLQCKIAQIGSFGHCRLMWRHALGKGRIEAFSDGVIAVIITIMVLEMKAPHGTSLEALWPLLPVFSCYALAFVVVGIYWNNHHHLWHLVHKVNGNVMWANLHLLFWLSLFPFVTGWMGENDFASVPAAAFGVVALMSAVSYTILVQTLIAAHGKQSPLAQAIGSDVKGKVSLAIYAVSIPLAFHDGFLSFILFMVVAVIWFVPDARIEKRVEKA